MLEDAHSDAWIGNGSNHSQLAATMGALRLKSMANTRFSRAIQLIGAVHASGADSAAALALFATLGRATMPARSRALGANTPW